MELEATVFVVDDDDAVRDAVSFLLRSAGRTVETYASCEAFLDAYRPHQPGCLVVDVRMPGMSGLELQEKLAAQRVGIPVIIITGHGDVPMAVHAMKAGAVNFIEKPFKDEVLLNSVERALEQAKQTRKISASETEIAARLKRLTPREREVMDLVVAGDSNKAVAARLGISPRTVEIYRARVMEKMQARTLPDLVRLVLATRSGTRSPNVP